MSNNSSVKKSLQPNKKAFSELDDSLFVEIELGEEEKASGGGIGKSPDKLATSQTTNLVWAMALMF
jgi:hypothetical protein